MSKKPNKFYKLKFNKLNFYKCCKIFLSFLMILSFSYVISCGHKSKTLSERTLSGTEILIESYPEQRPDWLYREPGREENYLIFIGISERALTERDARNSALRDSVRKFAAYCGVEVNEVYQALTTSFTTASGITDPTETVKVTEEQTIEAYVRRVQASEWYIEKRGTVSGRNVVDMHYRVFVKSKVPYEEYLRVEEYKNLLKQQVTFRYEYQPEVAENWDKEVKIRSDFHYYYFYDELTLNNNPTSADFENLKRIILKDFVSIFEINKENILTDFYLDELQFDRMFTKTKIKRTGYKQPREERINYTISLRGKIDKHNYELFESRKYKLKELNVYEFLPADVKLSILTDYNLDFRRMNYNFQFRKSNTTNVLTSNEIKSIADSYNNIIRTINSRNLSQENILKLLGEFIRNNGHKTKITNEAKSYIFNAVQKLLISYNYIERERITKKNYVEDINNRIKLGIEMIWIPNGWFIMGSEDGASDERPVHRVYLDGYWMSKYPITQEQWTKIMNSNPSEFKNPNHPVENVSWIEANKFITILNQRTGEEYSLPTEAQWEYAALGGRNVQYATSTGRLNNNLANYDSESGGVDRWLNTSPVGSFPPNPYGLYDMTGNVWEWCYDYYGPYTAAEKRNPRGAAASYFRVVKGGSWRQSSLFDLRIQLRNRLRENEKRNFVGFRIVRNSN